MKVKITINTENAVFDNHAGSEVARILRKIASDTERMTNPMENGFWGWPLADINGNTVGKVEIKGS